MEPAGSRPSTLIGITVPQRSAVLRSSNAGRQMTAKMFCLMMKRCSKITQNIAFKRTCFPPTFTAESKTTSQLTIHNILCKVNKTDIMPEGDYLGQHPIILNSVANYIPHLSHFCENVKFTVPTFNPNPKKKLLVRIFLPHYSNSIQNAAPMYSVQL